MTFDEANDLKPGDEVRVIAPTVCGAAGIYGDHSGVIARVVEVWRDRVKLAGPFSIRGSLWFYPREIERVDNTAHSLTPDGKLITP